MENIDQLAIILGHEIAHAVMGHAVSASLEQDFTFSYHFDSNIEILPAKIPKLHIYMLGLSSHVLVLHPSYLR